MIRAQMTTEQKTVPFWKASKHMKENYVVYAVSLYFIRVFNNMHQFYSTEGWKEIGCFIEPNFPCISRPDIDYYTGQPKEKTEEIKEDLTVSKKTDLVQALESAIDYCYELHSKATEKDPSFEALVGIYETILRKAMDPNQPQIIKLTPCSD